MKEEDKNADLVVYCILFLGWYRISYSPRVLRNRPGWPNVIVNDWALETNFLNNVSIAWIIYYYLFETNIIAEWRNEH